MDSPERFQTTQWSCVANAAHQSTGQRQEALRLLCQRYWIPLYAYSRRLESNEHDAQDLIQSFFAELLEKEFIAQANPQRGRFRTFLITALKNFAAKQWRLGRAAKRGGGHHPLSLDFALADSRLSMEPADSEPTPDIAFERCWAVTLLEQVVERLKHELESEGRSAHFELLQHAIAGDESARSYAEIACKLAMTESAARMAASRLRSRYRQLLRAEIRATILDGESIDDEIKCLFSVLAGP